MNNQPVFEILRAEVERTRQEYAKSNEHFWMVCADVPSDLPHPDGTKRVDLVARAKTAAMIAYTNALRRFNKFLLEGEVPDELLSKSGVVPQPSGFSQEQRQAAKCAFCGADTRMYENDYPICNDCASRLDAGEKLTRKQPASEKGSTEQKKNSAGS
jgi:hypothetical protein